MSLPDALAALPGLVAEAPLGELPAVVGALVQAEEAARLRLRGAETPSRTAAGERSGEPLDAAAVARRTGMSRVWIYRNAGRLPFARRIGRRLVFDAAGLDRWLRDQRAR